MSRQVQITSAMRAILIDWLVEVQQNFELHHETLYIAVKLVDRFLEAEIIDKHRLQLLGATALMVASKFEVWRYFSKEEDRSLQRFVIVYIEM